MTFSIGRKRLVVAVALMALILGLWSYSEAVGNTIVACVTKDGSIKISSNGSTCDKGQALLTWNIVGPKGDKGDKGDTGAPGPQYHLYDANNQDLGVLIDNPSGSELNFKTLLPDLGIFVGLRDNDDQNNSYFSADPYLAVGQKTAVLYTGTNCTGDPFLAGTPPLWVLRDRPNHYLVPTNDPPITRTAMSYYYGGVCESRDSLLTPGTFLLRSVSLPFTEPVVKPVRVGLQ